MDSISRTKYAFFEGEELSDEEVCRRRDAHRDQICSRIKVMGRDPSEYSEEFIQLLMTMMCPFVYPRDHFKQLKVKSREKKYQFRISKLEARVLKLEEELKRVKEQLSLFESWKNQAPQNPEEGKKQRLVAPSKLEGSKPQLFGLSGFEQEGGVELQKISQEPGPAQYSEQEGVQKHNAIDSIAMSEIQQLKVEPEKKHQSKIFELGSKILKLEEELKSVKDQLSLFESWKNQALQNAESSKKQQLATSLKLEGSKQQLLELSSFEKECGVNLQKISQEPNPTQYSEQEGVQKHNAIEFVAMNEIQQLKVKRKVKKYQFKASKLEPKVRKLEEELTRVKDQLSLFESWKNQAPQNAEERKKQQLAASSKLEGSKQQIFELYGSKKESGVELKKISQEVEPTQHFEQEGIQEQYAVTDFADLAFAMNDIKQLKVQLGVVSESEAAQTKLLGSANAEIKSLKNQLQECKKLVAQAQARVVEVTEQHEAKLRTEKVHSDQWRKAAEAGVDDLSSGIMQRSKLLDSSYETVFWKVSSHHQEMSKDDLLKKKNGGVLKKIGGLWKKPQK